MALKEGARALGRCTHCIRNNRLPNRSFSHTPDRSLEQEVVSTPPPSPPPSRTSKPPLDPNIIHTASSERKLIATTGKYPIGSRRRRAAIASSTNIPFHQLPYQAFQEARSILQSDREEKIAEITRQRERIQRLDATAVAPENEAHKEHRLRSMRKRLEESKVLADINDPLVKKRFEDGSGDMNKPIYRHLADVQWRTYKRQILIQRITQMTVIPDVLPYIDPIVSTSLSFGRKKVQHGEFVDSTISENPPTIDIQCYNPGPRLVTIAVINPDVPNVSKDAFDYRCHFLASNVLISPTETHVDLASLDPETQVLLPWLPPYAQKGAPYQRMSIFILEQPRALPANPDPSHRNPGGHSLHHRYLPPSEGSDSNILSVSANKEYGRYTVREDFILRSFVTKYSLEPVGVDLFRTQWDDGTAGVMQRAGVTGWDVEFKRKRVEPLPYKRLKAERYR